MTGITEKALDDFQAFEEWLHKERLLDADVLYRGHGDSRWSLESTLYRHQHALSPARDPAGDVPVATYADAARNLQAIVETHTNQNFGDIAKSGEPFTVDTEGLSFRYAVYLRHHGFPSPLLDWSLSPYVAAYFAFRDAGARRGAENGQEDDEPRVAIYVMRPPKYPYMDYAAGKGILPGEKTGIRYWPNPVQGEARHYDQQSAYTTAMKYSPDRGKGGAYCYASHEDLLRNFPQEITLGTNYVTHDNAIDGEICWKLTLPRHERDDVLQRLDRMNMNAYTLFRTEDALVKTYGERELRRMLTS